LFGKRSVGVGLKGLYVGLLRVANSSFLLELYNFRVREEVGDFQGGFAWFKITSRAISKC